MSVKSNDINKFARVAYDGYCEASGGKSLKTGEPLPPFDAQSDAIKEAWRRSARRTIQASLLDIESYILGNGGSDGV